MAIRFTDILRDLIIENARFQILLDKYAKPSKEKKAAISFKTLFKLIAADPTTRVPNGIDPDTVSQKDMDKVKIGKYVQWILKNYIQPDVEFDPNGQAMEDLYTVTSDLMKYERFKNRILKYLQKKLIAKRLPEVIQKRKKAGFHTPIAAWMMRAS